MRIDGKAAAAELKERIRLRIESARAAGIPIPVLAIIQVGNNEASTVYIKHKVNDCREVGISSITHKYPTAITTNGLIDVIKSISPTVDGIMVQLPLPEHIDEQQVLNAIPPDKDVDGLTDANLGWVMRNGYSMEHVMPCTAAGIVYMLKALGTLHSAPVLILNRSNIVGKPLAAMLLSCDAAPIVAHSQVYTDILADLWNQSEIVVTAIGVPHGSDWLADWSHNPQRTILVDVSTNRNEEGKLCGDVDPELYSRFRHVIPSPGGAGPMTRAFLLWNVLLCWYSKYKT